MTCLSSPGDTKDALPPFPPRQVGCLAQPAAEAFFSRSDTSEGSPRLYQYSFDLICSFFSGIAETPPSLVFLPSGGGAILRGWVSGCRIVPPLDAPKGASRRPRRRLRARRHRLLLHPGVQRPGHLGRYGALLPQKSSPCHMASTVPMDRKCSLLKIVDTDVC